MLRQGCTLLAALWLTASAYALPPSRVDSLRAALPEATDSLRGAILVDLCWELMYVEPQQALSYGLEALGLAEDLGIKELQAQANNNIGFIKYNQGSYEESIEYFFAALKIDEARGDPESAGSRLNGLGMVYTEVKLYEQAFNFYHHSAAITESLPRSNAFIFALNGLGLLYFEQGMLSQAIDYFFQMAEVTQKNGRPDLEGVAFRHLGEVHKVSFRYDSALYYFARAIRVFRKYDDYDEEGIALHTTAEIYYDMGNYTRARQFAQQALDLRMREGIQYGVMITESLMAKLYQKLDNPERALEFAESSLARSQQMNAKVWMGEALDVLISLHMEQKDYDQALAYRKARISVYDSIFNEEVALQMAGLQLQFDLEKKEQQIAVQEQQIGLLEQNKAIERKLRLAFIISTILGLCLALFIYRRYQLKQRVTRALYQKNEEIAEKNREIARMNRELEKKMLRAQMDPHFVFNSLSAIQHFITISDKTSALKYLSKFSRLIRQVLENSASITVTIADEIRLLEYYLELESLRYNDRFEYHIKVDERINIYDTEIPFLLIQPYVENSIVHGFCKGDVQGKLEINLERQHDHVLCSVIDNGIGRETARKMNGKRQHISRGMSVTQQRLSLINQEYEGETSVQVIDLRDSNAGSAGTKVEIRFPLTLN